MSHITLLDVPIVEAALLFLVLEELGVVVDRSRRLMEVLDHQGRAKRVEAMAETQEGIRLGIRRTEDGRLEILPDWSGARDREEFSRKVERVRNKIRQRYSYHKVKQEVEKRGLSVVEEQELPDGSIRLVVRSWR